MKNLSLSAELLQNKPRWECQEVQYELHGLDVIGWVCLLYWLDRYYNGNIAKRTTILEY